MYFKSACPYFKSVIVCVEERGRIVKDFVYLSWRMWLIYYSRSVLYIDKNKRVTSFEWTCMEQYLGCWLWNWIKLYHRKNLLNNVLSKEFCQSQRITIAFKSFAISKFPGEWHRSMTEVSEAWIFILVFTTRRFIRNSGPLKRKEFPCSFGSFEELSTLNVCKVGISNPLAPFSVEIIS